MTGGVAHACTRTTNIDHLDFSHFAFGTCSFFFHSVSLRRPQHSRVSLVTYQYDYECVIDVSLFLGRHAHSSRRSDDLTLLQPPSVLPAVHFSSGPSVIVSIAGRFIRLIGRRVNVWADLNHQNDGSRTVATNIPPAAILCLKKPLECRDLEGRRINILIYVS